MYKTERELDIAKQFGCHAYFIEPGEGENLFGTEFCTITVSYYEKGEDLSKGFEAQTTVYVDSVECITQAIDRLNEEVQIEFYSPIRITITGHTSGLLL